MGACDALGRRPELLWELTRLNKESRPTIAGATPTEELPFQPIHSRAHLPRLPQCSPRRRSDWEWEWLGFPITRHPLNYYLPAFMGHAIVRCVDMAHYAGQHITMVGWIIAERRVGLKERGCMKFITLEDGSGVYETVLFPDTYQQYGHLFGTHGPYLFTGIVQHEDDYYSLIAEQVEGLPDTSGGNREGWMRAE